MTDTPVLPSQFRLYRVRNTGPSPVTLKHKILGNVALKPGQERTVPIQILLVNLGDPSTQDNGRDQARTDELNRVRRKWGFNRGMDPNSAWTERAEVPTNPGIFVGPYCPTVEVHDEDGNRIYFIHDDPTGEHASTASLTAGEYETSDTQFLARRLEELEAEQRRLVDQINAQNKLTNPSTSTRVDDAGEVTTTDDLVAKIEASLEAEAEQVQSQAERNAIRDDIPPPPPADSDTLTTDSPRTSRIGGKRGK